MNCELVFIGALRSKNNSVDYSRVLFLLEQTLRSIFHQSSSNFRVIISSEQNAEIHLLDTSVHDSRLEFVDVPAYAGYTTRKDSVNLCIHDCRMDKARKYVAALQAAKKHRPKWIMFVDLDDFVNRALVSYILKQTEVTSGWYVNRGYVWDWRRNSIFEIEAHFDRRCGTSLIVDFQSFFEFSPSEDRIKLDRYAPAEIDSDRTSLVDEMTIEICSDKTSLDLLSPGEDPFSKLDPNYLLYVLGSHRWAAEYFNLAPLPFFAAVQNKNTGENHHGDFQQDLQKAVSFDWNTFFPECYCSREDILEKWTAHGSDGGQ